MDLTNITSKYVMTVHGGKQFYRKLNYERFSWINCYYDSWDAHPSETQKLANISGLFKVSK